MTEKVNHPKHYNKHPSGVECIDIAEGFNFNLGSAIKYIWRAGMKPGEDAVDDLRKAIWYLDREYRRMIPKEPPFKVIAPDGWTQEDFDRAFEQWTRDLTRCQP
jgi:hypothetical protein